LSTKAKQLIKKWKNDVGDLEGVTPVSALRKELTSAPKVDTTSVSKTDSMNLSTPTDEGPRKPNQDGLDWPSTGNGSRDKCGELIYAGLSMTSWSDPTRRLKLAVEIEQRTYKEHFSGGDAKYKARIRSIYSNLKDKNNPGLREQVLQGDITVEKFCGMTTAVRFILND
jgi:transcription elongation factor S-II